MMNKIIQGDCLEILKTLPNNSVDSIITDPPYELGFMGKNWDNTGIANNVEMWKECLRVLKPGGNLLSFGGTRTYHRMASAIENAGFEVRDMIEWVYGSGFPKSLNIGKAIDKINGKPRPTDEFKQFLREGKKKVGLTSEQIDKEIGTGSGIFSQHYVGNNDQIEYPTKEKYQILKRILQLDDSFDYLINWAEAEREVIGKKEKQMQGWNMDGTTKFVDRDITLPFTNEAKQWSGWGTALKPAHEPICMARKPLSEKTVAENCLKWGTGGINIDESRVESNEDMSNIKAFGSMPVNKSDNKGFSRPWMNDKQSILDKQNSAIDKMKSLGRFPANLIHDGSEEVRDCFPETGKSTGGRIGNKGSALNMMGQEYEKGDPGFGDSGSASRFFKSIIYVPKASKAERNRGLDCYLTVKYNSGICKEENMVAVELLKKVTYDTEIVNFSIDESGENITAQCHKDSLSTILTGINKTIELRTLNSLQHFITNGFIQDVNSVVKIGINPAESVESLSKWLHLSTKGNLELARGVSNAVLQMLLKIKDAENWNPATNFHATVKPIALMEYLIKMVTPKGGIVLDPFAGSGSTLIAAKESGYRYIGIEMEPEYIKIANARINAI